MLRVYVRHNCCKAAPWPFTQFYQFWGLWNSFFNKVYGLRPSLKQKCSLLAELYELWKYGNKMDTYVLLLLLLCFRAAKINHSPSSHGQNEHCLLRESVLVCVCLLRCICS